MKRIRQSQIARQICRRLAATLLAFAAVLLPFAARAEKANVFFIHGANVSEQDGRAWAAEMFKRLWQAEANMEFHLIGWEKIMPKAGFSSRRVRKAKVARCDSEMSQGVKLPCHTLRSSAIARCDVRASHPAIYF